MACMLVMVAVAPMLVCVCVLEVHLSGGLDGAGVEGGIQVVLELGELLVEQEEGETALGQ